MQMLALTVQRPERAESVEPLVLKESDMRTRLGLVREECKLRLLTLLQQYKKEHRCERMVQTSKS